MDFKQIQELIKLINDTNIGEVTIEQKEFRLTIKQKEDQVTQMIAAPMHTHMMSQSVPQQQPQALPAGETKEQPKQAAPVASNTVTIKSPMIGTFYRRPSPDKSNFV